MPRNAAKPYLTIEETANTLRVSERTVRRWIASGVLASRKIARTVRIPATSVRGDVFKRGRPLRGRPRRKRQTEELDLAALLILGGSFDWLHDPREEGYSFEDGEPV
jgi:excisionase family DNA binding protein